MKKIIVLIIIGWVFLIVSIASAKEIRWDDFRKPLHEYIEVCHNDPANISVNLPADFLSKDEVVLSITVTSRTVTASYAVGTRGFEAMTPAIGVNGTFLRTYFVPVKGTPATQSYDIKIKRKHLIIGENVLKVSYNWKEQNVYCKSTCCSYIIDRMYFRGSPTGIIYEKYNIQFDDLQNWEKPKPGRPNMILYRNPIDRSLIVIRVISREKTAYTALEKSANSWLDEIASQQDWRNIEKKADGKTVINGEESYWREFGSVRKGRRYNEKIYFVHPEKFFYVFRIYNSMPNAAFSDSVKEFDAWVKTIQFIPDIHPSIPDIHPFIRRWDRNNDGKVSKAEFSGMLDFSGVDIDSDGYIEQEELLKVLGPGKERKGGGKKGPKGQKGLPPGG